MTWVNPEVTPDEQAFELLKEAVERGCTLWNAGEFYGIKDGKLLNLELLQR